MDKNVARMHPSSRVSIATVERETGLSKDTLRVWERRYGFPTPQRTGGGHRQYDLEEIEALRESLPSYYTRAVIEHDVEAARHRDDELVQRPVRMPTAVGTAGHVVQVIHTLDGERHMPIAFDEGQVAAGVVDPRQGHEMALVEAHRVRSSCSEAARTRTGSRS